MSNWVHTCPTFDFGMVFLQYLFILKPPTRLPFKKYLYWLWYVFKRKVNSTYETHAKMCYIQKNYSYHPPTKSQPARDVVAYFDDLALIKGALCPNIYYFLLKLL